MRVILLSFIFLAMPLLADGLQADSLQADGLQYHHYLYQAQYQDSQSDHQYSGDHINSSSCPQIIRKPDTFLIDAVSDGQQTIVTIYLRFNTNTSDVYQISDEVVSMLEVDSHTADSILVMRDGFVDFGLLIDPSVDIGALEMEGLYVEVLSTFIIYSVDREDIIAEVVSRSRMHFIDVLHGFGSENEIDQMQGFVEAAAF